MYKIPLSLNLFLILFSGLLLSSCKNNIASTDTSGDALVKHAFLDVSRKRQTIDGFGVNITPAQWHDGKLKSVLDSLVDDLGCTLFRFDCVGLADWLDPTKRDLEGKYPKEYLQEVYTNKTFSDAWACFRYLNQKQIRPQFNVSGRIHPLLGRQDNPKRLKDFDAYAEMICTMLRWARDEEKLAFDILSPFNETDLGFPEGPKLEPEDVYPAVQAMINKLDSFGLTDIRLVLMDDTRYIPEKISPILNENNWLNRVVAFGTHCYGNGHEGEKGIWYQDSSDYAQMVNAVATSPYAGKPCWMTEYGDLDQTNEIEFEFGWRSTRRLLKFLDYGFSGAEAWDAFDNFHEHDTTWATYGLFHTDSVNWTYYPKRRYFAARHVFRFVPPGYRLVNIKSDPPQSFDIYENWRTPLRNIILLAFISPDETDITIVGMSKVEQDVSLQLTIPPSSKWSTKKFQCYRSNRVIDFVSTQDVKVDKNIMTIKIKEGSIFTVTTLLK